MSKHKHKKKESSIKQKKKSNNTIIIVLVILFLSLYIYLYWNEFNPVFLFILKKIESFIAMNSFIFAIYEHFKSNIIASTYLGIFYINFILGLFFIPGPGELIFFGYLLNHINPIVLIIITTIASTLAQLFNYGCGYLFGKGLAKKISGGEQGFKKYSDLTDKYGTFILILFVFVPFLPSQPAAVLFGSMKYPFKKFIIINSIVLLIKCALLVLLFYFANNFITSLFHF